MLLKKNIRKIFETKFLLFYKFLIFLVIFSLGMALAIYFKEDRFTNGISLLDVIIWQWVLWVPMVLILPLIMIIFKRTNNFSNIGRWTSIVFVGVIIGIFHFIWFYQLSNQISPYLGVPKTKFGVFPYFFIFWITIDVIIISAIIINFEIIKKTSIDLHRKKSNLALCLKQGNKKHFLKADEILWIEAVDYYVRLHTVKGKFLERKSLKAILEILPQDIFIRIHRSTIVNVNEIVELRRVLNQKAEIKLSDGSIRSVSRNQFKALKNLLPNFKL